MNNLLHALRIALLLTITCQLSAQTTDKKINGIPYPLTVYNEPAGVTINENGLDIAARGKTNLFNNPNEQSNVHNAPMLLFEPKGDFRLTAKVTGDLKAVYDVAALVVYQDENLWAKFCYENSVQKKPTIVSVVTRTYSDDCNSVTAGKYAYLSVVRKGKQYSFFYSADGIQYEMVRHFHLLTTGSVKLGFAAHGSRGEGFTAKFSEISFLEGGAEDLRKL